MEGADALSSDITLLKTTNLKIYARQTNPSFAGMGDE
jgi:hypothetical protein